MGDIVLAVDQRPLKAARELKLAVFQHAAGDEITLDIRRGTETLRKTVAVLPRSKSPGDLAELANQSAHLVRRLGILALSVDEKVTAILPDLRRLVGVAVAAIPAEFAALNPGLAAGDVICALNGTPLGSLEELRAALDGKKPGAPIALQVERAGELHYLSFELE